MTQEIDLHDLKVELRNYMELYCKGKSNAMTQDELAGVLDIHDPRLVRLMCQELDLEGFRIIGDNAGMYHPTDVIEEEKYANTMFSQAEKMLKRAKHHIGLTIFTTKMGKLYREVTYYNTDKRESPQKEMF